ncbi:MAG: mechanosensitive ion channel domain-containing protein [Bacteroides sp.]|jgi:small-conductance mechanosensitive channel|nr:mechanosensitive ion channel domain-containing protein [Bacteroides sp.]
MESIKSFFLSAKEFLQEPLFSLGKSTFTLSTILYLIISIYLLFFLTAKLKKLLADKILAKYNVDIGIRQAISTILRYVIVTLGLIIIIQTAGIDMSFVTVLAGALGVGIGFGLQNITNNFVSGIVILVERPVKIADRIEVITQSGERISGDVIDISARATTILTNDNIAIIVPNSNLITSAVINWSYNDKRVRFNFIVPVHYSENPELVKKVLLEVARENDGILKTPIPDVLLDEFGDSSINYILRVWTSRYIQKPGVLRSQLYYAIVKKFRENNITIPYPQMDLYLKEVPDGFIKAPKA